MINLTKLVSGTQVLLKTPSAGSRFFSIMSPSLSKNIYNIQDEQDFKDRVLNNTKPVIVDFHAKWCGPCKILGPRMEKLMSNYENKAEMAKVDIDQLSDIAEKYNIQAVPTVIAFKGGKQVNNFRGLIDDDKLKSFVKDIVDKHG